MSVIDLHRLRWLDVQAAEIIGKLAAGCVACIGRGRVTAGVSGSWIAAVSKR